MIQGSIEYGFKEAIDAFTKSSADIATLTSRWLDLCDTEEEKDVTISLSSGETSRIPNLAKVISALKARTGKVEASSVKVSTQGGGSHLWPSGVETVSSGAKWANGVARLQHSYKTPYNEFYDCCYLVNKSSTVKFMELPRFVFFNVDSVLDDDSTYTVTVEAPSASAGVLSHRSDSPIAVCTKFTVLNADPTRAFTLSLQGTSYSMPAGKIRHFIAWGFVGGGCSVAEEA